MGNTCASIHVLWRGEFDAASKAICRSYGKLGYKRVKKSPSENDKRVLLATHAGQPFISIYDDDNASLDNGELKDLALAASRALKTTTVFTSLYDSDTYEFILFANGKQLDFLASDIENYTGPLKQLTVKTRAAKWNVAFGLALSNEQIAKAVSQQSAFADDVIAALAKLIGLRNGQAQLQYQDLATDLKDGVTQYHFRKKPLAPSDAPVGAIHLTDYFDPDDCRMRSVYPASWPIAVGSKRLATWLILSQGAGFSGGTATVHLSGSDTSLLSRAIISACKFHNGQIVGQLESVAPNLTKEDLDKLIESKRFKLVASETEPGVYRGEFPNLIIPSMTPERTTQILVILQMDMEPNVAGSWEIKVSLRPGTQTEYQHALSPLRISTLDQKWLPLVSGLNSKTIYDKLNLSPVHLQELHYKQSEVPKQRQLDHPAVTSTVAILKDDGQPTLDAARTSFEAWLSPLAERQQGEIRIHAEKQMTAKFHVGKTKKSLPCSNFLKDKIWGKLFELAGNFQSVFVSFLPEGAECAIAGIGLQQSLKEPGDAWRAQHEKHVAATLATMRGRPCVNLSVGSTWHLFKWIVNQEDCYKLLQTSAAEMTEQLDQFATEHPPLQAWSSQCTWIPVFDRAGGYERTVYEDASLLNWFRGLHNDGGLDQCKMTSAWCSNVLRMVAPHMWLCRNLLEQFDRARLERVAQVSETNDVTKITLKPECAIDDLELALLPILPVESARIKEVR
jgi:hypothetical protein